MSYKELFYPNNEEYWIPNYDYHDIYIDKNGGISKSQTGVNCWYFDKFADQYSKTSKTIIFFHGNAGNISHRQYMIDICHNYEINLLLVEYRGFGKSKGNISPGSIIEDSEASYKYLFKTENIDPSNIIIWGESLGGFASVHVASKYDCSCLILLSCFSSISDAIKMSYDKISWKLFSLIVKNFTINMNNSKKIRKVKCPVLIAHSTEDNLIPFGCAEENFKNISHENKILIPIRGEHINPKIDPEVMQDIFKFADIYYNPKSEHIDLGFDHICAKLETLGDELCLV